MKELLKSIYLDSILREDSGIKYILRDITGKFINKNPDSLIKWTISANRYKISKNDKQW